MPGRETEYTCLTPSISASTCSIGRATRFSTSFVLAPGKPTNTLAKVTSICGSSSRGVTITAKIPSSIAASASNGVRALSWKRAARPPEIPSLSFIVRHRLRLHVYTGTYRIQRDALSRRKTGEDLRAVAKGVSGTNLAQAHLTIRGNDVDPRYFASPQQCPGRHEQALGVADNESDLHEHARVQRELACRQF